MPASGVRLRGNERCKLATFSSVPSPDRPGIAAAARARRRPAAASRCGSLRRSSCRACRPRPCRAGTDAGRRCGRDRRCSTFWMSSVRSRPTRSDCSIGPSTAMRAPKPSFTTVSSVSASQTPAATSAIASRFKRVLQPVADEARDVALHMHRTFAGVAQQRDGVRDGFVAGLFVLDHLDQRHEMRRIPEMGADHALAVLEVARRSRSRGSPSCCWRGWCRARSGLQARRRSAA